MKEMSWKRDILYDLVLRIGKISDASERITCLLNINR